MILPLNPFHAPFAAAIHAAAFPPSETWTADAFTTLLASPGAQGWLDDRGALILYRRAADEADLLTLAVLPDHRRQGLAAALLAASLARLHTQGIARLFLEVAETNLPAISLYQSHGFTQIGRRLAYYPNGQAAMVMRQGPPRPA